MPLDLNCDLGEGCPHDAELMALIDSASIACGGHAGGPETMFRALAVAREKGVRVGAHPGWLDRENFGRRDQEQTEEQVYLICVFQVGALHGLARAAGVTLRYLKPHGALYNQACRREDYARGICRAAALFGLAVMGLPGSELERAAKRLGLSFIREGFADRRYLPDGSLAPRGQPGAVLDDPEAAACQARRLIEEGRVDSLCVHGDNPQALAFVHRLRQLLAAGK